MDWSKKNYTDVKLCSWSHYQSWKCMKFAKDWKKTVVLISLKLSRGSVYPPWQIQRWRSDDLRIKYLLAQEVCWRFYLQWRLCHAVYAIRCLIDTQWMQQKETAQLFMTKIHRSCGVETFSFIHDTAFVFFFVLFTYHLSFCSCQWLKIIPVHK